MIRRDYDLLKQIDEAAIIPEDLQGRLDRGVMISYSFSTLDDRIGKIFEPGATAPSHRLTSVKETIAQGFLTGISMMPLLPFISDTTASLHQLFSTFKEVGVDYLMPATITLFGDGKADSKALMMNAIRKHFPDLEERYQKYFAHESNMPAYYQDAFYQKMKELGATFAIRDRILL
jgi:DNA repair photolyase